MKNEKYIPELMPILIDKHGIKIANKLMLALTQDFNCDYEFCDDELCILNKAINKYIEKEKRWISNCNDIN